MGERDIFNAPALNQGADAKGQLNGGDILRQHNSFSIAKEPGLIAFNTGAAMFLAGGSKHILDSMVYDGYSIQPLMHSSDCILTPHPVTHEPIPNWQMPKSGLLRSHFENSEATKMARQATLDRLGAKETLNSFNTAKKAADTEVVGLRKAFGHTTSERIFGSFANDKALGQNILRMDESGLARATSAFKLGEGEVGMIRGARQALQTEASMVAANAKALETYGKTSEILFNPVGASAGRTLGRSAVCGTAAIASNLLIDRAAVGLADSYYGQGSKLGRVMETNAIGLGLSTFAAIAAPDLRSKVVLATAGWLAGKAYNYFTDA